MTNKDPGYKSECGDAVADYDYELGLTSRCSQPEVLREVQSPDVQRSVAPSRGFAAIVVLCFALFLALLSYLVVTQMDNSQMSNPKTQPTQTNSEVRTVALSVVWCSGTATDAVRKPSYQAAPTVVYDGIYGVPIEWPGYVGVSLPEGLPPKMVEAFKLCWWWNWHVDSNGCGNYYLEPKRLR